MQADVLTWLEQPVRERIDLIVVDPPTLSNSKRMEGTQDVQRDHVLLLNRVLRFGAPGGTVWFSTNYRRFKIWEEEIRAARIQDVSKQTVPEDFRNKKIHQCFRLTAP